MCQPDLPQHKSFSPLVTLLPERTAPELQYLQTQWVGLLSYGVTATMLKEVLPLGRRVSTAVLAEPVARGADRVESALGEEQAMFVEGCPATWAALPEPDGPISVGLDGGVCTWARGR